MPKKVFHMSKQIQFKASMLTRLLSILLFFTVWMITSLIYVYMFKSANTRYHIIFSAAISFLAVRLYLNGDVSETTLRTLINTQPN